MIVFSLISIITAFFNTAINGTTHSNLTPPNTSGGSQGSNRAASGPNFQGGYDGNRATSSNYQTGSPGVNNRGLNDNYRSNAGHNNLYFFHGIHDVVEYNVTTDLAYLLLIAVIIISVFITRNAARPNRGRN